MRLFDWVPACGQGHARHAPSPVTTATQAGHGLCEAVELPAQAELIAIWTGALAGCAQSERDGPTRGTTARSSG